MRIPINLASQPYENLRPFYLAAGVAAVLLVALSSWVAWNLRLNRNETRMLTEQNDRIENDLKSLRREQRELEVWLAKPEVREIRDRSAFLNSLILRKSLSWTQMFMDLEKILPDRVEVTAIHPTLNESLQPELHLTVSAGTVQPLVQLLKELESAPQFGSPAVESQRFPAEKATDPNIILELKVGYHQVAEEPAAAASAGTSERAGDHPATSEVRVRELAGPTADSVLLGKGK